jgi:hypothetical protein
MTTVHGLWVEGMLTAMEQLSISSFLVNGFDYDLYTYGPVLNVPAGAVIKDAREILPESRIFRYEQAAGAGAGSLAGFSNLFRYRLLLLKGGTWADLDVVCLRPLNETVSYLLPSELRPGGFEAPASCLLRYPPASPLARYCWEAASCKQSDKLAWGEIGPELVAQAIKRYELEAYVSPYPAFCPIHYWQAEHLTRVPPPKLDPTTVCVHLWHEIWRRQRWDKDAAYLPGCLYEQLKSRFLR